jgi:hypothetical protein
MLFLSGSLIKYSSAPLDAFSQEIESQFAKKAKKWADFTALHSSNFER